jgi:cytochrome c-type biogenesis protein CcmH/NrfF
MIYPPPAEKQILDVLPYALIVIGIVLIIDSARRFPRKAK